jgi:hypothetical protein
MVEPHLPIPPSDTYQQSLSLRLTTLLRQVGLQIDQLKGGYLSAHSNQRSAAPTTGLWAVGDQVRNDTPSELGTVGSKYVITGWICVTSGEPGTWKQMRVLTGN